jgi:hypothetical protein
MLCIKVAILKSLKTASRFDLHRFDCQSAIYAGT